MVMIEINKFGETFNIKEKFETFTLVGDLIKTVQGDVIINAYTKNSEDSVISNINGDYRISDNRFDYTFKTDVDKYDAQIVVMDSILTAIKTILN
jgi:hypothetical protein